MVSPVLKTYAAQAAATAITLFARAVTSVRGLWVGIAPEDRQRVYYANHTSNGDFVLVWTVLPVRLRRKTRPVAALDYWLKSPLKAFIGKDVFNAVLIDRNPETRVLDPVQQMIEALDQNSSLILFPEGQRNASDAALLPFKSGLYHLAKARPDVDLIPVWIANLNRVMPKGEVIPIPLICTVTFGAPLHIAADEPKDAFLARAEAALLALVAQIRKAPQMNAPQADLLTLLLGLAGVLIVASSIGYVLAQRYSPNGENAVVENLNARINAWWVMIILMGIALIGGKLGVTLLFALCSFAALREFITLTTTQPRRSLGAAGRVLRGHAGAILSGLGRMVWASIPCSSRFTPFCCCPS